MLKVNDYSHLNIKIELFFTSVEVSHLNIKIDLLVTSVEACF